MKPLDTLTLIVVTKASPKVKFTYLVLAFFLISLEAHQTYSVNLKTIAGQDYRDLDAQ